MRPQYEPVLPLESNSFTAFIKVKKEFNYPFHYHPEYELTYILSSSGLRYVGNLFEEFEEDDFVLLGPHLPHCWKNIHVNPQGASALVIQWNADLLGADWLEKKEFSSIKRLLQLSSKGVRFPREIALEMKEKLIALIEAPAFEKMMGLVSILNHLSLTNKYHIICEQDFSSDVKYSDSDRLNVIYQYLKINYKEKITLTDIASLVHMTEESFSRFFSKLMKKTFFSFLNEYRINISCKLLIETDWLINQVCYQSGYQSLPFFYRQFKRIKHCSPQYFREQFKSTGNFSIPAF